MADFISTMTQQKALKDRQARQEYARQINQPGVTGEMTDTPDTLRSRLGGLIAEGLMKLGMSGRGAYDLGGRTENVAEYSPLGMLTGMEDVARAQDPHEAALAAMGLIPGFGAERRAGETAYDFLKRTMAEKGKDIEWFHPVGGGVKLRRPFSEMTSTTQPTGAMTADKLISPEQLPLGSWLLPLYGDKTIAGQTLTHVNEVPLATGQHLGGGGRFMQENPNRLWASDQGKASTASKKVQQLERESGLPVLATHVSMGPAGSDFAKMTPRTMLQLTDQKAIPDELAAAFDARMPAGWPGIKNVNADEWLASAPGGARAELAKVMQLAPFQRNPAFGDVGAVRKALTEPELMHEPMLTSGMSVGQFAPGGRIAPEAGTHESYSTDWLGQHLGNMGQVPFSLMFPDVLSAYLEKNPSLAKNLPTIGYSVERQMPAQKITREWQDRIMPWWLERGSGQ